MLNPKVFFKRLFLSIFLVFISLLVLVSWFKKNEEKRHFKFEKKTNNLTNYTIEKLKEAKNVDPQISEILLSLAQEIDINEEEGKKEIANTKSIIKELEEENSEK